MFFHIIISAFVVGTNVEVSSENVILLDIPSGTSIPTDASHILVYTKNGAGEMSTGISTRILDRIQNNLLIIPEQDTDQSKWFGVGVSAVVCRVDVTYAPLNLGYVNEIRGIDQYGNRVLPDLPVTVGVQYPFYASPEYLLSLGTTINMNVKFNHEKHISCQATSNEP